MIRETPQKIWETFSRVFKRRNQKGLLQNILKE
jgi:hypothetical protein